MFFLCIYCEDPTPLVISTIEYKDQAGGENNSGSDVTTFSICLPLDEICCKNTRSGDGG